MDITVSSGAFFDEVQDAIMQDKSIPLIYTQKIENNEETNNDVWQIGKYYENKNSNYCKITQQILILLKNVNENMEKNSFNMSDRLIKKFNDNKRSKGGIQLLGNLYHFCCNVATEKQLNSLILTKNY